MLLLLALRLQRRRKGRSRRPPPTRCGVRVPGGPGRHPRRRPEGGPAWWCTRRPPAAAAAPGWTTCRPPASRSRCTTCPTWRRSSRARPSGAPGHRHTALVDGYVVEGHVPADVIRRMLGERPQVAGIAVPGMPAGSPGMEVPGGRKDPYDIIAFSRTARSRYTSDADRIHEANDEARTGEVSGPRLALALVCSPPEKKLTRCRRIERRVFSCPFPRSLRAVRLRQDGVTPRYGFAEFSRAHSAGLGGGVKICYARMRAEKSGSPMAALARSLT